MFAISLLNEDDEEQTHNLQTRVHRGESARAPIESSYSNLKQNSDIGRAQGHSLQAGGGSTPPNTTRMQATSSKESDELICRKDETCGQHQDAQVTYGAGILGSKGDKQEAHTQDDGEGEFGGI
jgi:hypothetical protein